MPRTVRPRRAVPLKATEARACPLREDKILGPLLVADLEANLQDIVADLGSPPDLAVRRLRLGGITTAVLWMEGLAEKTVLFESLLAPLTVRLSLEEPPGRLFEILKEQFLPLGEVRETCDRSAAVEALLSGHSLVMVCSVARVLVVDTRGWQERAISEPPSEVLVRGPREGFTETLRTNTAMLRRKLRTPRLRIEKLTVGSRTRTEVAIVYIDGVARPQVVAEVKRRLARVELDGVLETAYLEEFLEDGRYSLFPTVNNTERPDVLAASLLEGRVGIMVDGTPIALRVPALFLEFFQSPEDYYSRYPIATLTRWVRLFSLMASLLLPAIYVAVTTFHPEMIPTTLLVTIAGAREGVPFPALVEAALMQFIFEILREAGLRMPRPVGQAVSIVGALVLGEAAMRAGVVSAPMVIVVAGTAIGSFAVARPDVVTATRILQFVFLVLAGMFGLYGILIGLLVLHVHLTNLRSFGVPYLSPLAPGEVTQLGDVLARRPFWARRQQPSSLVGEGDP